MLQHHRIFIWNVRCTFGVAVRSSAGETRYPSHVVKLGPIRAVDLAGVIRMSTSTLSRNLQPLIASGWIEVNAGDDARSRLISAMPAGQAKRTEAQRKWRIAQEGINQTLGAERVMALHALIDESLELLSPGSEEEEES